MPSTLDEYPEHSRDNWILERRPPKSVVDPSVPYSFSLEDECNGAGEVTPVATVFLTNKECPWRCLMCDLWRNTLQHSVPVGAIPAQIDYALARLPPARHIKLYNSGSFFDRQAIPIEDYSAIAKRLDSFERVIVESHPALLGGACLEFRDLLKGRLEVAVGLETAHPEILSRLNKKMTLQQFSTAAAWLKTHAIDLRTFILVKPPFLNQREAIHWAERSLDFAFACESSVAALIPTRAGNGALDHLAANGEFAPPSMQTLEAVADYGLNLNRGRVLIDLWDLQRISNCGLCYQHRHQRFHQMNLRQTIQPPIVCTACE